MREGFSTLLERSVAVHGHLCPGQVLGVRMSVRGLEEIGIRDPRGADRKRFVVFVEMDRCATDAIQSVTGCSLGKRSMKFLDYGKMAATFLNTDTNQAVRVLALEEARETSKNYVATTGNTYRDQLEAYKVMPDEELFAVMAVYAELRPEDAPGRPLSRVRCDACGEHVQDLREMRAGDRILCRPCASGGYYRVKIDP